MMDMAIYTTTTEFQLRMTSYRGKNAVPDTRDYSPQEIVCGLFNSFTMVDVERSSGFVPQRVGLKEIIERGQRAQKYHLLAEGVEVYLENLCEKGSHAGVEVRIACAGTITGNYDNHDFAPMITAIRAVANLFNQQPTRTMENSQIRTR